MIPSGSQFFQTTVSLTYNDQTFDVQIEVGLRSDSGLIVARFLSIDPATSLPPNGLTGFLPPEDGTGRGQGHFSYVIKAKAGVTSGTEIRNIAFVTFDGQDTIATNQNSPHDPAAGTDPTKEALVTIDVGTPTSTVSPLSATNYPSFSVNWSGSDDAGGSGIGSFDVLVSDNGGSFSLWLHDTAQTSAIFSGQVEHSYAFYSVGTDNVGHREAAANGADTSTSIVAPPLPDYNGNNVVDAADYVLWRKSQGNTGLPLYSGADGDGNGLVDQNDYAVWRAHFGDTVPMQPANSAMATQNITAASTAMPMIEAPANISTSNAAVHSAEYSIYPHDDRPAFRGTTAFQLTGFDEAIIEAFARRRTVNTHSLCITTQPKQQDKLSLLNCSAASSDGERRDDGDYFAPRENKPLGATTTDESLDSLDAAFASLAG